MILVLISVFVHPGPLHCAITTAASEQISYTQTLSCVQTQIWAFFVEQEVPFPHLRALLSVQQPWRQAHPHGQAPSGQCFGSTGCRASSSPAEEGSCRSLVWDSVWSSWNCLHMVQAIYVHEPRSGFSQSPKTTTHHLVDVQVLSCTHS